VLTALPLVLTLFPSAGLAPPEGPICTDTWIKASSGSWHVAANWEQGLPDEDDTVCIPAGVTVTYSTGTQPVQSLQVAGALAISGGTLKTTSTVDESTILTLSLSTTGTLGGSNTIVLTGSGANGSTWSGGTMTDLGTTRLASGASLSLSGSPKVLQSRKLELRGTATWSAGNVQQVNATTSILIGPGGTLDAAADVSLLGPERSMWRPAGRSGSPREPGS
jgi:G8 domain